MEQSRKKPEEPANKEKLANNAHKPLGETFLQMIKGACLGLENLRKQTEKNGEVSVAYRERLRDTIALFEDDFERKRALIESHKFAIISLAENVIGTIDSAQDGEKIDNPIALFDQATFTLNEIQKTLLELISLHFVLTELLQQKEKLGYYSMISEEKNKDGLRLSLAIENLEKNKKQLLSYHARLRIILGDKRVRPPLKTTPSLTT